jgi:hypothetical protein
VQRFHETNLFRGATPAYSPCPTPAAVAVVTMMRAPRITLRAAFIVAFAPLHVHHAA